MGDMGIICLYAEEHTGHKDTITFEYAGSNLDKKDLFSESDPFFTVSRVNPDGSDTVVYRSDYIKAWLHKNWCKLSPHHHNLAIFRIAANPLNTILLL